MTTENALPDDGDLKPLDNHASGIGIKPIGDRPSGGRLDNDTDQASAGENAPKPAEAAPAAEEIRTLDNHASGPRP
ncbi:hypothetical protein ACN20G_09990 [Streptomyces sp. BI20]|uniref:hypothetical protein n=1 Tax=Streptomyces sp. BI20 TaxID=3403460 RepID=UPI003C709792